VGGSAFGGFSLFVIVLGILLQNSGDDDPPLRTVALTVADFPPGWREHIESGGGAADDPATACDPGAAQGETARVRTGSFYGPDEKVDVWQTVVSFGSVADAEASVGGVRNWGPCLIRAIRSGAFDDGETAFSDASFDAVQVPPVGRRSEAYMFTVTATVGREAHLQFLAVVYFSVGTRASAVFMGTVGAPPDQGFQEAVALRAAAKVGGTAGKDLPSVAVATAHR
jgi:hypothetical protein